MTDSGSGLAVRNIAYCTCIMYMFLCLAKGKKLYFVVFVDLEKAFNRMSQEAQC